MTTVRPQDNFFKYVNKDWFEKTTIPNDKTSINTFTILHDLTRDRLMSLLEENTSELPNILFKQGMEKRTNVGLFPFIKMLREISCHNDVIRTFAKFNNYGISSPIHISIGIDSFDSSKYNCEISQGGSFLPTKDYYFKEPKLVVEYKRLINKVLNYFKLETNEITEFTKMIYDTEYKIIQKHLIPEERQDVDKTTNLMSLKKLVDKYPNLHLDSLLFHMNIQLHDREVNVESPEYLEYLDKFITKISIGAWQIYLFWCLIISLSDVIDEKIEALFFDFYGKQINGQKAMKKKNERIYNIVSGITTELIGELYIKKYFNKEIISDVEIMIKEIKKEGINYINKASWMGKITKDNAKKKIEKMNFKVGYPNEIETFDGLVIGNNFISSVINASVYLREKKIKKFNQKLKVDKNDWFMGAYEVNAYYAPSFNELVIPAGILQEPFYSLNQTKIENYAGIGYVIGHEIIHSLDKSGRKFDWKGNKSDWWTKADEKRYNIMSEKLIEQYNNYNLHGINVNGNLTLGENFADLLGFILAYKVATTGCTINDKIKFFEHFAKVERAKVTPQREKTAIMTDPHSPHEFRVNGVLSLIDDFYLIYKVKPTDKMYLEEEKRIKI